MRDPYRVLGLDATASPAAIKHAFRLRAKVLHPDANPGDPVAAAHFRELTEAYALLSDPAMRSEVDADLGRREERREERGADEGEGSQRSPYHDPVREMWPERRREGVRLADPDFPYREAWEAEASRRHSTSSLSGHWPEEPWTAMEAAGLDPGELGTDDAGSSTFSEVFGDTDEGPGPDLFDELYASPDLGRKHSRKAGRHEALDQHYSTTIPFMLAALGGTHRLILAGDRDLNVPIPAGIAEGTVLRFARLGSANPSGGEPGDAFLEIRIAPDEVFRREGATLFVEVPIDLKEAVLGGSVRVPTLSGSVVAKIPPGRGARAKLRLTGRGLPAEPGDIHGARGDLILELRLVLPKEADPELNAFLEGWTPREQPRRESGFDRRLTRKGGGADSDPDASY